MVNLDLYRVFYTVARCGSLTKAAEELYISQPAVSQAIKTLETQLGTPLFKRMRKGMELTAQGGELVYGDVEKAVKLLSSVEDRLMELRETATGTLRIGASASIFQYVLSGKIVEFRNLYPQVKIELISDVSPKIIECLKSDRCDVGFLNMPVPLDEGVQFGETIQILHDVFVVGKEYADLAGGKMTLADLQQYPLILMKENTAARSSFDSFCRNFGMSIQPTIEIDSWDFMKQLVTFGMGIGCIPREPALPIRSIGMATPKAGNAQYALRAFINLFKRDGDA